MVELRFSFYFAFLLSFPFTAEGMYIIRKKVRLTDFFAVLKIQTNIHFKYLYIKAQSMMKYWYSPKRCQAYIWNCFLNFMSPDV